MRLNQYLAKQLGVSRRQADSQITEGNVLVNGILGVLGQQVDPESDNIEIKNTSTTTKKINLTSTQTKTILFWKPIFAMCTRYDPQKRKTIYDFLPNHYYSLKSAGRLDYMSEGLLLMTNDGNLINEITHPSNNHTKTYLVALKQNLSQKSIEDARAQKITIDNYQLNSVNIKKATPDELNSYNYLSLNPKWEWYFFELTEGRNNQIRKMCMFFGQNVLRLIRTKHGEYELTKELFDQKTIELDNQL